MTGSRDADGNLDGNLFPVRFLGFGFFWAWLFLAGVTPSPLIGAPVGFGGAPFEMMELSVRACGLVVALAASRPLATVAGRRVLLGVGVAASAVSAPLVLAAGASPAAASLAAVAAAAGEVCMFLLWLCFFGYMKLGETFVLLVGSYAIGSVLFLLTVALDFNAMAAAAVLFPVLSGVAFALSQRLSAVRIGENLFGAAGGVPGADGADAWQAAAASSAGENPSGPLAVARAHMVGRAQQVRAAAALVLYSCAFSISCGIVLFAEPGASFTVEPVAMIALGLICLVFFRTSRHPDRPYALYRAVAPLMGLGFLLITVPVLPDALGGFCVALGYVLFELLVLNDCCNMVRANDSSLLRVMAAARLAITVGMFAGWLVVFVAASLVGVQPVIAMLTALGLFAALIAVSVVFTERDLSSWASVADDRALAERGAEGPTREEAAAAFAEARGLSRRETEVASFLLAGRTTSFAAEKLFIAESTVRAHVHSIYRKCDVHSRMELMDAFDVFWLEGRNGEEGPSPRR